MRRLAAWTLAVTLLGAQGSCVRAGSDVSGDSRVDAARTPDSAWSDLAREAALPDAGRASPLTPFGPPTPIVELNTATREDDPTLTGDLREIFFERNQDIWHATRLNPSGPWSAPTIVAPLSTSALETNPEVTADGLTLYFSKLNNIYTIVRATRAASWSAPQLVPALNSTATDACIGTVDNQRVVLGSRRSPSQGDFDLFLATRSGPAAAWGPLMPIVELNTASWDCSPWLDMSGTLLYWSSHRAGQLDIWFASRATAADSFGAPSKAAGATSTHDDDDPWLSADLRTIYFASNRSGGAGDMDLYVATRP